MEEWVLKASNGGDRLTLRAAGVGEDDYEGPEIEFEFVSSGLRAVGVMPGYGAAWPEIVKLLRDAAAEWRGWEGHRVAGDPERDAFALRASHDGLGHIEVEIFLRERLMLLDPAWAVRGRLVIDIGSAADAATGLHEWLAGLWPRYQATYETQ